MSGLRLVTAELLHDMPLHQPDANADKNTRGTVLVAGGSPVSAGAVVLSGTAAFRAGAGKVQLVVPQPLAITIAVGFPEAGVHAFACGADGAADARTTAAQIGKLLQRCDAALVGPGIMDEPFAQALAAHLLEIESGPALVIDALSLTALRQHQQALQRHRGRVVITPHAGEMARLMDVPLEQIEARPLQFAQQAASELQCVVVLKGATTVIAQPDGPAYQHEANLAALAISGSGDVLAGVLVGLMARGTPSVDAAVWSVYLHAQAGRRIADRIGPLGLLARELPAQIPPLMRDLSAAGMRGPQT
jgi:ADP-dependent NAD(P)H-hydrate dehydratase